jgi:hypothetical protein
MSVVGRRPSLTTAGGDCDSVSTPAGGAHAAGETGRRSAAAYLCIDVISTFFEWVPQIGDEGEIPSIEGAEGGF